MKDDGESHVGPDSVFKDRLCDEAAEAEKKNAHDHMSWLTFSVFVSLPPHKQSESSFLKTVINAYFTFEGWGKMGFVIPNYNNGVSKARRQDSIFEKMMDEKQSMMGTDRPPYMLMLEKQVMPVIYRRDAMEWWWKYEFTYTCKYSHDMTTPVEDQKVMDHIHEVIDGYMHSEEQWNLFHQEVVKEATVSFPFKIRFSPPGDVTDEVEPPINSEMDVQHWNWKRYIGLGLLLGTLSITCFLSRVARLRKPTMKEVWGVTSLNTQEGVDELLRSGWILRGAEMEVYYKNEMDPKGNSNGIKGVYEGQNGIYPDKVVYGGDLKDGIRSSSDSTEENTVQSMSEKATDPFVGELIAI